MAGERIPYGSILRRGLRLRCPQCGVGKLFNRWLHLAPSCPHCQLAYEPLEGNSWWFMYYSTAVFTGVIILAMLLIRPANHAFGRLVIFAVAFFLIVLSLPYRKGLAIAFDYLSELRFGNRPELRLRDRTDRADDS